MITATVVDEIRRMLREGRLSQRKIAVRIGVSRGTVNAIALGKRALPSGRPAARRGRLYSADRAAGSVSGVRGPGADAVSAVLHPHEAWQEAGGRTNPC